MNCGQINPLETHRCHLESGHNDPHEGPPIGCAGWCLRWPRNTLDKCAPPDQWMGKPLNEVKVVEINKGRRINLEE